MKNSLFTLLVCSFFLSGASAQQHPAVASLCKAPVFHPPTMKQMAKEARLQPRSGGTLYIPLTINVIGDDNGNGYYPVPDILEAVCHLNEDLEPYNFYFYIEGDLQYFDDSDFYSMQDGYSFEPPMEQFIADHNTENTLNCYIVDRTASFGGSSFMHWPEYDTLDLAIPWVTNFPQDHAIVLRKTHLNFGDDLFAHEVGHYLSLWHTFFGWEGLDFQDYGPIAPETLTIDWGWGDTTYIFDLLVERVDGLNCEDAGDFICDTPPDYLSASNYGCDGNGQSLTVQTDPTGQDFYTDASNYMSYAHDNCSNQFSQEQVNLMRFYAEEVRSYLLYNQTPPAPLETPEIEFIYPQTDETVPAPDITLEWNVSNGSFYHIRYGAILNGNFVNLGLSSTLQEPSFSIPVTAGVDYYWILETITDQYDYYPCQSFRDTSYFSVSNPTSIGEVTQPDQIQVSPNPFEDEIHLTSKDNTEWEVEILNIQGQLIHQQLFTSQTRLDLLSLPSGIYFIQCTNGADRVIKQILKQ